MQTPAEFTRDVGHALSHLYDPDVLRNYPLLKYLALSRGTNAQNGLRERLIEAIEDLKPAPNVPIDSRAWRIYKVLHLRYIQQLDQEQTAFQIGVGVRHLRREQTAAVTALADALYQKVLATANQPRAGIDLPVAAEEELAWLRKNGQEETSLVNETLRMVLQLVAPLASARGAILETNLAEDLPPAIIIPAALRQALISLTTLAINRLAGGSILFSTALRGQQMELIISARSERSLLPDSSGTAESLRTVRLILGDLNNRLQAAEVDPPDPNQLVFTLTLPAVGLVNILMIDDNKDVADLFRRYTYGTEFSIEHLSDPDHVFEAVERIQPRIILLDIMIPRIDGWELLGRLRQHPLTQGRTIIVCSVLPERELALALGANDYLPKPATRAALLDVLYHSVAE